MIKIRFFKDDIYACLIEVEVGNRTIIEKSHRCHALRQR